MLKKASSRGFTRMNADKTNTNSFIGGQLCEDADPAHRKPCHKRCCASLGHVCERFWGRPALRIPRACRDPNRKFEA